jgi:hypothetical protein
MAVNFTTWRYDAPYGAAVPGMFGPEPLFRDALDARRSAYRRVPEAEYPDGYLGTITSRHEDKLLRALKANETGRPTQRGVHKGETIDPGDYFWPKQFQRYDRPRVGSARQEVRPGRGVERSSRRRGAHARASRCDGNRDVESHEGGAASTAWAVVAVNRGVLRGMDE